MFSPEFQDECYDKPKQMPTELGKNKELVDIIYIVEETLFSFIPVFGGP
jgi:hypothetical protein